MRPFSVRRWLPAGVFAAGCGFLLLSQRQQAVPLSASLSGLPQDLLGFSGRDVVISKDEERVAGMSSYVMRVFSDSANTAAFSIYAAYYESQTQGKSIHSPKNCLPGAGWEPLSSSVITLAARGGRYQANRYLLANGSLMALVYYWYQGRGRVQSSEYAVKWDLLRDKAIWGRSEEALVRIVVPLSPGRTAAADSLATRVATALLPEIASRLPPFPHRPVNPS